MAKSRVKPRPSSAKAVPAKSKKTATRLSKPAQAGPAEAAPVKKPRKKKAPPRLVARWAVYDSQMRPLAVFDYNQRPAAEKKIRELREKKNAEYLIQLLKEPMVEAPAEPDPAAPPQAAKSPKAKAAAPRKSKPVSARTLA